MIWKLSIGDHNAAFYPTKPLKGSNLPRKEWLKLDRIQTGQSKYKHTLHKWGMSESPKSDCAHTMCLRSYIAGIVVDTPADLGPMITTNEETEEIEYDSSQLLILSVIKIPNKNSPVVDSVDIGDGVVQDLRDIAKQAENRLDEVFNINEDVDEILSTIAREILLGEGDPSVLPNWHVVFQYRPFLITYTGTLDLTIGQLQDLATVRRDGDATLTFSSPSTLKVSIPLSFRSLIAVYSFIMRVRWDTAEGILHAWFNNTRARYNLTVDLVTSSITNREFVIDVGSVTTNLFGTGLSSSYRNLISDLTRDLLIQTASEYADAVIGSSIDNAVLPLVGLK
ncbi:hypothetical protein Trydic_g13940 [Trypoxylus dichotomus]